MDVSVLGTDQTGAAGIEAFRVRVDDGVGDVESVDSTPPGAAAGATDGRTRRSCFVFRVFGR